VWSEAARILNTVAPGALAGALQVGQRLAIFAEPDLRAKLRVFELFERSRSRPEPPSAELVAQLAASRDFDSLWEMEGLGYRWGLAVLRRELADGGLLRAASLPGSALLPLHTGAGMAFAVAALDGSPRQGLERFLDLCARSARPGWEGAMHETLGLAVRTLRPDLAEPVDTELLALGGPLSGRFWHGLGRALYFAPTNHLPWVDARSEAVAKALREPPHGEGRVNVAAGLAWAVALVHALDPERVARFAAEESRSLPRGAVEHGLAAASVVWELWSESGTGPSGRPGPGSRDRCLLEDVLAGRRGRPEDLFHYAGHQGAQ